MNRKLFSDRYIFCWIRLSLFYFCFVCLCSLFFLGCSTAVLKTDENVAKRQDKEFTDVVSIEKVDVIPTVFPDTPPPPLITAVPEVAVPNPPLPSTKKKPGKFNSGKGPSSLKSIPIVTPTPLRSPSPSPTPTSLPLSVLVPHEPDLESPIGYQGRRPIQDPFRVGEKVVLEVSYFKAVAGELWLETESMSKVNGRQAYNFVTTVKSSDVFSMFYSVDDRAETFVDYESMTPSVFRLQVKESSQVGESKAFFDPIKQVATFWNVTTNKSDGRKEKKKVWDILPYSQNVYSAAFYMRTFTYEIGKEYAFRVANDGENIIFRGKALRKEKLKTEAGEFQTIVVKPEFEIDGYFKPVGNIYFWLTDDDRKLIVRIESEIKIGSIVCQAIRVEYGNKLP